MVASVFCCFGVVSAVFSCSVCLNSSMISPCISVKRLMRSSAVACSVGCFTRYVVASTRLLRIFFISVSESAMLYFVLMSLMAFRTRLQRRSSWAMRRFH